MGLINFNKSRPLDLEQIDTNLYYRHDDKWLCLATNCKNLLGFGSYNGFKYVDTKLKSDNPYIKKRVG